MSRLRRLVVLFAVAFVSCQLVPTEVGRDIFPSRTTFRTAEAAFHVLVERHVDRPGSKQLLSAALDAVEAQLKKDGVASPTVERPQFTGNTESDFSKFSAALDGTLRRYGSEQPDALERAAVDGMAKSLNECHTYYLDPERAKGFNQPPGEYEGIGATVTSPSPNDLPEVAGVFPDSPAEKAGLRPGDKIKTVDGIDVSGFTTQEVANRIRGPGGTSVALVLIRDGTELTVRIVRARLRPPQVIEKTLEPEIGYVSISALNGEVALQTRDAIRRLKNAGVRGFILDVRNDPGGDLGVAVDVASIFLRDANLAYRVGRDGKREPLRTVDGWYVPDVRPLVVLVNRSSASGAEIIAAGIRANGAGEIIGARTAGCVGTGRIQQMPDGGILLVTDSRMQDARTGEELNGADRGIAPGQTVQNPNSATDAQLDAAIAYIKQVARR